MADLNVSNITGIGVLLLLAFFMYSEGMFQSVGVAPVAGEGAQPITVQVEGACGVDSTTLTSVIEKKYSESTSMTNENVTIVRNGGELSTKKDGQSDTVSPGDTIDLYFGLLSATYYTSHAQGTIPCKGSVSTSDNFFKPEGAFKLYQQDAATSSIFTLVNDDGTSTNPGTAQAITTGDTKKIKLEISPTYEDGLGIPCGNVLACQYNTSAYADSKDDALRLSDYSTGAAIGTATDPSNTLWTAISTDHSRKSWSLPAIDGKITTKLQYWLTLQADETNEVTAGGGNVNCTIYDTDYFKTDDGAYVCGIEDTDDNSDVGLTSSGIAFMTGVLVS